MQYSPNRPLMVLAYNDNHEAALPVPPGKSIDVMGPAQDDRFLIVNVDGEKFLVFRTDIPAWAQSHNWAA